MTLSPEQRSEIFLTNIATSDCGVIAIQALTGLDREHAEELARKHGYIPHSAAGADDIAGTPRGGINAALREFGFTLRKIEPDPSDTPATFALCHEFGRYVIYTPRHVSALVDGDLHNMKGIWNDPLDEIYEVTK